MKSLILGMFIFGSAFGADHIQNFYVADSGLFIEGGYSTMDGEIEYDFPGLADDDFSSHRYNFLAQYALSKAINLGVELARTKGNYIEGMEDYRLFLRGQKDIFFYGVNFYYSPEDAEDDTAVTGGNHLSFEGGLFKNGFGAKLMFQPEFSIDSKDSDEDKDSEEIVLEAFYEKQIKGHIIGAGIGQQMFEGIKENGTQDTTYTFLRGYGALDFGKITFLPGLAFYNATEKHDLVDEISFTQLDIKARFSF